MLCATLGIEEIFRAASDAQRIADYLLAFHPDYAQITSHGEDVEAAADPDETRANRPSVTPAVLSEAA